MGKNNLTIHQTDERTHHLEKLLNKVPFKRPTHVYAPNVLIEAHTLEHIEDGSIVFCGRYDSEAKALSNSRDITLSSFLENERFQATNSRLTAEGALMIMLEHSIKSISECCVLILGFGRTGAAVARILNRFNVVLDVATTSSIRPAHAFAHNIIPLNSFDFAKYDIIINTVPSPIVKDSELMSMRAGTIYIDLASKPAINLEYAKYLGVDADIYPALPAKICPLSAAKAMYDYIIEVNND